MEVDGWILDKSAAARSDDTEVAAALRGLAGTLFICPIGELEQLYSARSARDYDRLKVELHGAFPVVGAPTDIFDRALDLQRDLAHHHGMWHRTPITAILIAVTAIHHRLGVVHVDGDFDRIAQVRDLEARRLARPSRD